MRVARSQTLKTKLIRMKNSTTTRRWRAVDNAVSLKYPIRDKGSTLRLDDHPILSPRISSCLVFSQVVDACTDFHAVLGEQPSLVSNSAQTLISTAVDADEYANRKYAETPKQGHPRWPAELSRRPRADQIDPIRRGAKIHVESCAKSKSIPPFHTKVPFFHQIDNRPGKVRMSNRKGKYSPLEKQVQRR